jgi:T5SS/PEP-CTERM-associated repeat protein
MTANPTIRFNPVFSPPFDLGYELNWFDPVSRMHRLPNDGDTVVFENTFSITNNMTANYVYGDTNTLVSGTITGNRVAGISADSGGSISAKVLIGGGASNGGTINAQTAYSVNAQAGGIITAGVITNGSTVGLGVVAVGSGASVQAGSIVQNQTTSIASIIISDGGAVSTPTISSVKTDFGTSNGIAISASGAGSKLTVGSMTYASLSLSNGAMATVGSATHKQFGIDGAGSRLQYAGGDLPLGAEESLGVQNYASQSFGAVTVDAPTGQTQAYIGVSDHGILSLQDLTVGNGLVVIQSAGTISTSSATLPGQVSLFGTNSTLLVAGTATIGPALFGIFQGATLSTNGVTIERLVEVAGNGGLLKVDGGAAVIGDTRTAQVNVYSGATLSATAASSLVLGNAAASYGGISLNGSRYFPNSPGSARAVMTANNPNIGVMGRGFIYVRANSDLQVSGLLQLGLYNGGSGSLSLAAGSNFVDTGPGIRLGVNGTSSSGALSIRTSLSLAGYVEDGRAGNGSVFIYGSSANVSIGTVTVGELAGSRGSFQVAGKGATGTITGGNGVKIGDGGQGSLTVNNGGKLNIVGTSADVLLGAQNSASGSVYVGGTASMLQIGGRLSVAGTSAAGQGTLTVTNAGSLDVKGALSIGKKGTVTVQGTTQGTMTSLSSLSVASPVTINGGTIKVAQNGLMTIGAAASAQAADQLQIASGASVVGYGTITSTATGKAAGGNGASTWSLTVMNFGTIEAKGGTSLLINADLTSANNGEILIDPDSTLELGGTVGADTVITFQSDGSGQLILDDPADFHGTIAGMQLDDQIILKNTTAEGGDNLAALSDATVGLLGGNPNLQLIENGTAVYLKLDIPDINTALNSKGVADQFFNVRLFEVGGSDTVLQLTDGNPLKLAVRGDQAPSGLTGAGVVVGIISAGVEVAAMEDMVKAIAPNVTLKVFDIGADRSSEQVATAIFALANQGCNVIVDDVSSGDEVLDGLGLGLSDPAAIAIRDVVQRKITYVTAVGNNEQVTVGAFGHQQAVNAIKVAAMNWLAAPAPASVGGYITPPQTEPFSRQGFVDVTGPDAGPTSTTFDPGNIDPFFGTSAAAPVVAGIIALMMQNNPQLKRQPGQVKAILQHTADPLSSPPASQGAGLADAASAIAGVPLPNPFYTDPQPTLIVASAVLSQDGGNIGAGTMVQFQLTMNETVTVSGGEPALILSDGAVATYDAATSQPDQAILVFDYLVGANDRATNLSITGINLNGATVRDAAERDADFTGLFNAPSGVSVNSPLSVSSIAASQGGELQPGQTARLTLTLNQPVTVVTDGGAPTLVLSNGATATYDPGNSNPGASLLTFSYTVAPTDLPIPNLSVFDVSLPHGTTVRDGTGNNADFTAALNQGTGLQIGSVFAEGILTSPTTNASTGDSVRLTLVMSGPVNIDTGGGSPTLTLNDGAIATYNAATSDPGTGLLAFDYSVGSESVSQLVVAAIDLNGATVLDGAGVTALIPDHPNFPTQLAINSGTPVCYCRGTHILTAVGEVAVEELRIGDRVRTLSGELKPIVWIGMGRDLVTRANKSARPIVVRRGAIADNVPHADLYLTHGHSLYLDGVLIPVENLINHHSILWDAEAKVVEYYHIELPNHDVVLAEGAAAESYYDDGNRVLFQNRRSVSNAGAATSRYAPVLNSGEVVEAVWTRLAKRAGIKASKATTEDPDLHLAIGTTRIDAVSVSNGTYTFTVERPTDAVYLRSRSAVPSLIGQSRHEHRRLGVALRQLIIQAKGTMLTFDHDAPLLREGGCHAPETEHCWTDGELKLPVSLFTHLPGPVTLVFQVKDQGMRYPVDATRRRPHRLPKRAARVA